MPADLRDAFRGLVTGALPWPLYLWGPAGGGKTSAALVLLDHCGRARPAHEGVEPPAGLWDWTYGYADVRTLPGVRINADRGSHAEWFGLPERWSVWDRMLSAWARTPVAVLDEIGVGATAADFRLDVLIDVLNQRCDDPVRPLVVTGNLKPSELEKVYDDRVASRVLAGTVFHLDGPDRRMTHNPR